VKRQVKTNNTNKSKAIYKIVVTIPFVFLSLFLFFLVFRKIDKGIEIWEKNEETTLVENFFFY
jgi:hypothetical protein